MRRVSGRRIPVLFAAILAVAATPAWAQSADVNGAEALHAADVRSGRASSGLFGTAETGNPNIAAFTKWTGMLKRFDGLMKERQPDSGCVTPALYGNVPCARDDWAKLVQAEKGRPIGEQLDAVNRFLNHFLYITDPVNWGIADYWADPTEFLKKNGDCEDYAISKYLTLKAIGVDPKRMRIVVLEDLNLRVSHAILAVKVGSDWKILDNQARDVVSHRLILHYQPIYSINETGWWLHRPAS